MGGFSSDEDDDGSDDLEVLPPPPSERKPKKKADDGKPRLSYSGVSCMDPVSLLEDEDDDQPINTSPRKRPSSSDLSKERKEKAKRKKGAALEKRPYQVVDDLPPTKTTTKKKPSKCEIPKKCKRISTSAFSSSSEDEDDSITEMFAELAQTKPKPANRKQAPKATVSSSATAKDAKKREREAAKEDKLNQQRAAKEAKLAQQKAAKEAKRVQQQAAKQAKLAEQQAEQQAKRQHRQAAQQASGKLAHTEIVAIVDESIIASSSWEMEDFFMTTTTAVVPSCVQWIRRNATEGGAERALAAWQGQDAREYEHIPVIAVVVTGDMFLGLLEHDGELDDYPKLEAWITKLQSQETWKLKKEPRIILLLNRVQETLEKRWNNNNNDSSRQQARATMEELQDATTWLLIQFRVESIRCKSDDELFHHLTKMTRMLAEAPYVQETTEIACVKKISPEVNLDEATADEKAADCWFRQVQQVPNLSRRMAMAFVEYYPTSVALWRDYMDPTVNETSKRMLASTMFHEKKQYRKLASQLYTVMTSQDPDQVL